MVNNIFDSNSSSALGSGNFLSYVVNNVFYNNNGSAIPSNGNQAGDNGFVVNNLILSNATAFGENGSSSQFILFNNNLYGNTTNYTTTIVWPNTDNITTEPSVTDAANADFTVGASSPLIATGLEMADYTSLSTDFKTNIGIDQSDHVTAGGGNVLIIEGD